MCIRDRTPPAPVDNTPLTTDAPPVATPAPTPPTADTPVGDSDAIIQTGLNGVAGCSVSGKAKDGLLPGLALLSVLLMATRRRKMAVAKSRSQ